MTAARKRRRPLRRAYRRRGPRSLARLVKRFGSKRVFETAQKCDRSRYENWIAWTDRHRHPSGNTCIYFPEATRQSRRKDYAHSIAAKLWHDHFDPNRAR